MTGEGKATRAPTVSPRVRLWFGGVDQGQSSYQRPERAAI